MLYGAFDGEEKIYLLVGYAEGVFVGMKEDVAKVATRYAMDREHVSNYMERFPSIVTPLQEKHLVANLECWIRVQIETDLGAARVMNYLLIYAECSFEEV